MGYLGRKEWELEASMIPSEALSQYKCPAFWPKGEMVDEIAKWRYYDHDGNPRPDAYLAMMEATGEEGPFTRRELEMWLMEEFLTGKLWMGEKAWSGVRDWVMEIEEGYDECEMTECMKGEKR